MSVLGRISALFPPTACTPTITSVQFSACPQPMSQPPHPALQATLPSCPHGGLEPPKCHIQVLRGSHISLLLLSEPVLLGLPRS